MIRTVTLIYPTRVKPVEVEIPDDTKKDDERQAVAEQLTKLYGPMGPESYTGFRVESE